MPAAAGPNILIVDDVAKNIQVVASILGERGYQMAFALDGRKALENAQATPPDLILLDVMMPDMDGFAVCRKLKAHPATAEIPVIFLTARTDTESIVQGFGAGGVDYVTKPFNTEELLARVATHLKLRAAERDLQEMNAAKDKFLSIVAHDLRSPFGAIKSMLKILAQQAAGFGDARFSADMRVLSESAENFYKLIENLLAWSRLQRGALECHPQAIDVGTMAFEMSMIYRQQIAQKNITVLNRITPKTFAYADHDMAHTVFRNLVGNALKFTGDGGQVELSSRSREKHLEIAVRDTGLGIAPEDQKKLFRIDSHYKRNGTAGEPGTGIGLILCQDLVEKNGGRIWLESAPGQGSVFYFSLPLPVSPPVSA